MNLFAGEHAVKKDKYCHWGIKLEYEERRNGDITSLSYHTRDDLVIYTHGIPHSSCQMVNYDHGIDRFHFYRRFIGRKPTAKTSWRCSTLLKE